MAEHKGALGGIKVLDLTDERGIYGVKLLADLAAEVVRPEPLTGDPLRKRGPLLGDESLWHTYFASNRQFVALDPAGASGRALLAQLVDAADIVVICAGAFCVEEANLGATLEQRPNLVVVDITSFGGEGPWKDYLAPDLVAGALGGAAATTGDVDTPPLKAFGELNFMVSGAYVAIAALSALLHVQGGGSGQRVGVSVHECIASCLEHVLMWYLYEDRLAGSTASHLPRRGSLHWSNAYQVMNAKSGSIMVTPAPDFEAQLFWLVEEEAQDDLIDPKYLELENRPLMIARMMEVLHTWVAGKDAETLFHDAQKRRAPYGWVLPVDKLATNPQLEARTWFADYGVGKTTVKGPGAPYQFSATPWRIRPSQWVNGRQAEEVHESQAVLAAFGWTPPSAPVAPGESTEPAGPASPSGARPLDGLRVLDFTHVLAGPFATRTLADMGADVIKVNSQERAVATNDPTHPYYLMWNRSKRALSLNMSNPEARPIARALAEQADVVIDNFSVGVLDRWGIGYDTVSAVNKGVVYIQMSGMGEGGPWSKYVTYAPTIHAIAGLTQMTGMPGREDIGVGFSYNDHQAGLHGAVAILAALASRNRTGQGQRIDLSQFETGVNFLGPSLLDWFANERSAEPVGNDLPYDELAPHGAYPCLPAVPGSKAIEDERWVTIACMNDAQWDALQTLLARPQWSQNAAYATSAGRFKHRSQLNSQLGEWTRSQDAAEVMRRCQAAGVPAGVVQTGVDLFENDPQLAGAAFCEPIDDASSPFGQTWADRLPLHFAKTPCDQYTRVREVGEDNAAVLADWLGMSAAEVAAGEADGRLS